MATINDVLKGLEIFARYGGGDRHAVDAQHDIIYSGPADDMELSEADRAALDRLGWHYDEGLYSWSKFT